MSLRRSAELSARHAPASHWLARVVLFVCVGVFLGVALRSCAAYRPHHSAQTRDLTETPDRRGADPGDAKGVKP